jgi:hypothetical protein
VQQPRRVTGTLLHYTMATRMAVTWVPTLFLSPGVALLNPVLQCKSDSMTVTQPQHSPSYTGSSGCLVPAAQVWWDILKTHRPTSN